MCKPTWSKFANELTKEEQKERMGWGTRVFMPSVAVLFLIVVFMLYLIEWGVL